ncbi:hypothetical protein [Streptomyces sp. NPDC058614]|uniref:hypothetical protein n=1 Tax=Streptomyces sp. NPDC058614 TaxID=3346557 RepID=UPI0036469CC6
MACADDARGSMVRLTEKGRQAIGAAAPKRAEYVRKFGFDPLKADETHLYGDLIDRILDSIERNAR